MGKIQRIAGINGGVLKQCREQLGLDLDEAGRLSDMKKLPEVERGEHQPTYLQLCRLADLYLVPTWVFQEKMLPREFRFQETPVFRSLSGRKVEFSYRVRRLVQTVEDLREHLLELCRNEGSAIPPFDGPANHHGVPSPGRVRAWLGVSLDEQVKAARKPQDVFPLWRKAIEEKNIFVFMTRSRPHWSKMEVNKMRGLALFHETLPVIVVNGSDSHPARTFTLMHELAHVLGRKTFRDVGDFEDFRSQNEESLCNQFAADLLMPREDFKGYAREQVRLSGGPEKHSRDLEPVARHFGVSPLAAAVQMCRLGEMKWSAYRAVKEYLALKWEEAQGKQKETSGGPPRNIPKETLQQFGGLYTGAVLQAFYDKEISLSKLCGILSLTKVRYAGELEELL